LWNPWTNGASITEIHVEFAEVLNSEVKVSITLFLLSVTGHIQKASIAQINPLVYALS